MAERRRESWAFWLIGLCPPTFFLLAPQTDKSWKMHDNDLSE
jgi:hypothetical protein